MTAFTVADIKRRVKRKFGDEAGVQITDADIIDWINDAQREVAGRNDSVLSKYATTSLVSGQQEYSFPVDFLKLISVGFRNTGQVAYQPLQGLTTQEMNLYVDGWDGNVTNKATPLVYTIFNTKLIVFPVPQDSVADALKIYYVRRPTDVALDADVIDLPELYHLSVVDLVLLHAYEMDEDWDAVTAKSSQASNTLDRLRDGEEWTEREFYPTVTVLPEDW